MDDRKRGISSASASTSTAKKLKKAKHKADGELPNDDVDMDLLTGVHKLSELPKRGIKLFGLDTSQEENERLHKARGNWHESILATRTQSRKTLSVAHWNPGPNHAEIDVQKGNYLASMGVAIKGKVCLFPEEAVYLVDQAVMELNRDGLPLSFQECVTLMLTSGIS